MAYRVIILTTPTYKTFQKFNEKKLWRLTIIFQQIILVCNQAVCYKGNRFVVILDNLLEKYC